MIRDEEVKEIIKHVCKPGKKSDQNKNQLSMIQALVDIKNIYLSGFPEEDAFTECLMIEKHVLEIISKTLGELTSLYD